jgi:hypothetical protein
MPVQVKIKEHSFFARLAAWKLKTNSVAIVFASTIHLYKISKRQFLKNENWLLHELEHIRQYRKFGFIPFLCLYLWEWMLKGYFENRFEVEARLAEKKQGALIGNEFYIA